MKIQSFRGPLEPWIRVVERILTGWVEVGHPNHPTNHASTTLAGDNTALDSHNGLRDNVAGSWVELELGTGDLGAAITCNHNLGADATVAAAGEVNVRWQVWMWKHDGTGVGGVFSVISCNFRTGDAITANSIDLRFYALGRTVDDDHKLKVTLRFVKAARG